MYSGTTFRTKSGRVMGVHQKIDRVARKHLTQHLPDGVFFPSVQDILHFEGLNGPDGVKRKSPAKDEPWHYVDPANPDDRALLGMIHDHIHNLAEALKQNNNERAAFEAAWMAHAITDGLTPAHHYPLEAKLEQLRDGKGLETRISAKDKIVLPGKNKREQLKNNWEFWGAKGVMTTHFGFELGVMTTIAPAGLAAGALTDFNVARIKKEGFETLFLEALHDISQMKMYEEFSRLGWTRHLVDETQKVLMPRIIQLVGCGWYQSVLMARGEAS